MKVGSSPRMWGTQFSGDGDKRRHRFIPTHVGNSTPKKISVKLFMVHPHACGELLACFATASGSDGSSPRMWGTRHI